VADAAVAIEEVAVCLGFEAIAMVKSSKRLRKARSFMCFEKALEL